MPAPSKSALLSLALLAIAAAPIACAPRPGGVHVIVTMRDSDFDDDYTFDHLTVTARIGDRLASACLYPADAVDRTVALDAPSPNACADLRTQEWNGPPTAASWALEGTPRTLNVEALEGEEVEITVVGGLGGKLGTVRATGKLTASPAYPDLTITLAPEEPLFRSGCPARFESSFDPDLDAPYTLCDAVLDDCPAKDAALLRSAAITCLDDGTSRLRNGPKVTCGGEPGESIVWHKPPIPTPFPCLRVFVRAQFVRCKEGDPLDPAGCVETTACAPKPVSIWTLAKGGDVFHSWVDVSCLPPTAVPITWSVFLDLPDEAMILGISQSPATADDDACFVDVLGITSTSNECVP